MQLETTRHGASAPESASAYFRLTDWPSDAFLIGSPIRALLTGLLEREPLTVGRLATLSGETVTSCREFLMDLEKEGVVETLAQAASPSDFPPRLDPVRMARH